MSVADDFSANSLYQGGLGGGPLGPPSIVPQPGGGADEQVETDESPGTAEGAKPLHRLAEVRRRQGVSVRSAARRMGVPAEQVRQQEATDADIRMSDLHRWQRALDVPLAELLVEQDAPLSGPVMNRARMLRVMKTVRAIAENNSDAGVARLTAMLETQLLEIMPELGEVGAWHSVGQRRTQDEVGRVAERPVSDSFARDGLR